MDQSLAPGPAEAARAAGLRYADDSRPGITRRRAGRGFAYRGPDGRPVRDRAELRRIRRLAVPPAWTDVWIAPDPAGHLQATGRDARGRKQYRYHERWRATRDEAKFARLATFARALPRIRARVTADLRRAELTRERVLAAVVRLLDVTLVRIGNDEYARENGSFGLTTLRERHVAVRGTHVRLRFKGKSGVPHDVELDDPRVARVVRRLQELPGQQLFQYVNGDGEPKAVSSEDVNAYLREAGGDDFTAKDFRTWAGTLLAARTLRRSDPPLSDRDAKRVVVAAIDAVARELRNTRAVCRACYIHPAVIARYLDGSLHRSARATAGGRGLAADERWVLRLLANRGERARAA